MTFAPAAGGPTETTIHTSAENLDAADITIKVADGQLPGYYARPKDAVNAPVILVVQEIFGVHEHIKDLCRRLAHEGYFAVAPELYFRQGDPRKYTDIPTLFAEIVNHVPDAQVMSDLDATVAWAASQGADVSRLAVTGFCWGGRITWLYAAHNPNLKAAVAWYGRLDGPRDDRRPRHPVDVAGELRVPVLALYGGADEGIPLEVVEKMKAALAQGNDAAKRSEFVIYPDAPHAFLADYRPSYRVEPAKDGWRRMLERFRQALA